MRYLNIHLEDYLSAIAVLPKQASLTKDHLLTKQFLLEKHGDLEMYFSPHNEYINREARIVIVGITPGWTQMRAAFEEAVRSMHNGATEEQLFIQAKAAASFSGTMRTHLVAMLDECGLAKALHINSSATLFLDKRYLLHTTSLIKYPVFYQERNYTGHRPEINHASLLSHFAYEEFPKEMQELKHNPLIIPLGKSVEQVIHTLIDEKKLSGYGCLFGFPHPSGANGHRKKQFQEHVNSFRSIVEKWAAETI